MKSSTLLKRIALAGVASAAGFGLLRELDGDAVYKKQIQAGIMVAHRHAVATAMDDRFLSCFARAAAEDYANARLWDRFAGPAYRALGGDAPIAPDQNDLAAIDTTCRRLYPSVMALHPV